MPEESYYVVTDAADSNIKYVIFGNDTNYNEIYYVDGRPAAGYWDTKGGMPPFYTGDSLAIETYLAKTNYQIIVFTGEDESKTVTINSNTIKKV